VEGIFYRSAIHIIAHGVSANPWANGLGERSQRGQGGASAGESYIP